MKYAVFFCFANWCVFIACTGLEKCTNLVELYLDMNKIQKLENLETLTQLEVFSIHTNKVIR